MQSNILNATMRYGLIMGAIFSINFLLSISNNIFFSLLSYLVVIIILSLTYRFSIQYRDKENGGSITYGHAFAFIFLLFLFAAIISSIVKFVYFKYINPDFLTLQLNKSIEVMEQLNDQFSLNIPEDAYTSMEKVLNPTMYTLNSIWGNAFMGALVGIILAAFVKKEKSIFDKNEE